MQPKRAGPGRPPGPARRAGVCRLITCLPARLPAVPACAPAQYSTVCPVAARVEKRSERLARQSPPTTPGSRSRAAAALAYERARHPMHTLSGGGGACEAGHRWWPVRLPADALPKRWVTGRPGDRVTGRPEVRLAGRPPDGRTAACMGGRMDGCLMLAGWLERRTTK